MRNQSDGRPTIAFCVGSFRLGTLPKRAISAKLATRTDVLRQVRRQSLDFWPNDSDWPRVLEMWPGVKVGFRHGSIKPVFARWKMAGFDLKAPLELAVLNAKRQLERWQSGLLHRLAKPEWGFPHRRFESCSLRS